ncbi:MAG: hypothetical protein ACRD22_10680, partial [Terriglobia bacterium]
MGRQVSILVLAACLGFCASGYADFTYTETSQITGGAMAGMMKGLSVFSKSARQATQPTARTTYVKGSHLRNDNADGTYQIIDLDGQQIIEVDPAHQTYSATTFQQMREAVEKMQQRMNDAVRRQNEKNSTNVTMTPKIEVNPTGKTQSIMGQNAQEVDIKVDLQMQQANAQQGPQSATFRMDMDSWVAPSVTGFHEVSDFYRKMMTEIGWSPNATFGSDPRMMKSMAELYKSGKIPTGMPLVQTVSTMLAGQAGTQGAAQQQPEQTQQQSSSSSSDITNPSAAAAKALGGMFGGFG